MIINTVTLTPKRELKEAFIKQMRELTPIVCAEEGCITYALFEDPNHESRLFLFEEWKSQEALEKHLQQPHMQAHFAKVNDWFGGATRMTTYQVGSVEQKNL